MKKEKYNNLSINEKINYRAELKQRKIRFAITMDIVNLGINFLQNYMKNIQQKEINKSIYQLIK